MTPLLRHERELEGRGGPRFARAVLTAFGIAAAMGLVIGLLWAAAGLWRHAVVP